MASAAGGTPILLQAAQKALRENRELLRAVFDGMADALLLLDDVGRLVDVNPSASALFGQAKAALLELQISELEATARNLAEAWNSSRSGGATTGRLRLHLVGAGERLLDWCSMPRILPNLHLLALRDVTQQRANEARFGAMIEKSEDGVSLLAADGSTIYESPAAVRLLESSTNGAVSKRWQDYVPETHARVLAQPRSIHHAEFQITDVNGKARWIELVATNRLHDPDVAAIVSNFRDVTVRKVADQEREGFFEITPDLLCILGFDGTITRANSSWEKTLGWRIDELVGRPWSELVLPEDRAASERQVARLIEGLGVRFENRCLARDGSYRWLQWSAKSIGDNGPIYATARDVGEQRAAAERDRTLFTESPFPKVVLDSETRRFLDANAAALLLYGYSLEELVSMRLEDVVVPEERVIARQEWDATLRAGKARGVARHHLTRSGSRLDLDITSKLIVLGGRQSVILSIRDMTEQRRLEAQLVQAQKLESVGNLAGGIAHDFNNLMSIVLSYSMMMLNEVDPSDPIRTDLEAILKAGERARDLTHQLLAFSRQQILQPQAVHLGEVFGDMEKMLRRLLREDIDLSFWADADLGVVLADPGQLEQVIINLAVNSRDAMPRGGRLVFRATNTDWREDEHEASDESGKSYVMLSVTDTGHGMDAATRERIFEPFFTTKPKGQGTGLGLSTVFGIIRQTGGHIRVHTELGEGTTVEIYLPRTDRRRSTAAPPERSGTTGGSEVVLLVEDEEQVRTVIQTILQRAGYRVLSAADGREAFALLEESGLRVDAIISDVVMPGISGRELARQLSANDPGTKVLLMSGYTDDALVRHSVMNTGVEFYQKPITPDGLLQKLRAVLDTPIAAFGAQETAPT